MSDMKATDSRFDVNDDWTEFEDTDDDEDDDDGGNQHIARLVRGLALSFCLVVFGGGLLIAGVILVRVLLKVPMIPVAVAGALVGLYVLGVADETFGILSWINEVLRDE